MTVTFADLRQLGFNRSHQITLGEDGVPRFSVLKDASKATAPAVYIWLSHVTEAEVGEVLYVGKAGKGVTRRCGQHQGGFVAGKGAGGKNAAALTEILADLGISVTVMARTSNTVALFGKTVSLYATEEDALCALFGPRLNRAVFPDVTGSDKLAIDDPIRVVSSLSAHKHPPVQITQSDFQDGESRIARVINARLRVEDEGTVDDLLAQIDAYAPRDLVSLERLLTFIEERLLAANHALKLVGGYTRQPKGCDNVTTLGFGYLVNRNFAPKGWVARVYLTDSPRVAFPMDILNPNAQYRIEETDNLFSPLDLEDFLNDPETFINFGSLGQVQGNY